jgi:hypothetical protein
MRLVAGLAMIAVGIAASSAAMAQTFVAPTQGLLDRNGDWRTREVPLSSNNSLRLSQGGVDQPPGGLPLNLDRPEFANRDYEVSVIRNWPRAVSFETGRFDIDLSPHAGVGMGSRGGSAEAGAELRLQSKDDKAAAKLRDLGLKDGAMFGDQGRWYLFAAAGARAVGLNMLKGEGGWDRAGWTTDPAAAVVGDAHVGVGFRKGNLQTSFGVIHREVKGQHMVFGQETKEDTVAAFTFSIKPRAR